MAEPVLIPPEEQFSRPVEVGATYEARFSLPKVAVRSTAEEIKSAIEAALPVVIKYCGPSPADPTGLWSVIFTPTGFPPPSPELTEAENASVGRLAWLVGQELKRHCRPGVYRMTDVLQHPAGENPEPATQPPPSPIPLPKLPDLSGLINTAKWLAAGGAALVGGRYFGLKGAAICGLAATLLLQPRELQDLGSAVKAQAANVGILAAGGAILWLTLRGGRDASAEREHQPT